MIEWPAARWTGAAEITKMKISEVINSDMIVHEITENITGRNKEQIYDLLINTIESGPYDGGCVVVAQAI